MNLKFLFVVIIAFASLALVVPLFTDSAGLLPAWMIEAPYPTVFFIIWFAIIIVALFESLK